MDSWLTALAATEIAGFLRVSRWGYATVNAAHVLGIAVLVGGILPLDLRLLGVWRRVEAAPLIRVLIPMAAGGLALALCSGFLLFSVRPVDYAANPAFLIKIVLVCLGSASAISTHLVWGRHLEGASRFAMMQVAGLSMLCWVGALVAGRMIAFAGD